MGYALAPENVAVVVNASSWASVALAEAYVSLRGIPAGNVIRLDGLSHFESVGVEEFREGILGPVFAALEARGIRDTIDCIAYSSDIPYEIDFQSDLAGGSAARHVGNRGALTGLTYLYEAVLARDPEAYTDLQGNRYARRAFVGAPEAPLPDAAIAALRAARGLMREDKLAEAADALDAFIVQYGPRAAVWYDLACLRSLLDEGEAALDALDRAVAAGWWQSQRADQDRDLVALRERPAYAGLRERMEANRRQLEVQPVRAFRARTAWDRGGHPTEEADGRHYMLATMLGVTSGRGTSLAEAVGILQRAAAADGTRPSGTVYYMRNDDIRSRTRQWGFEAAVRMLEAAGVAAVIEAGALPRQRDDVAGAMVGSAGVDWNASESRILPGAICEHLTSLGGVMTWPGGQTPLTDFLRHGAAGATGTVVEPYAIQAKFPDPFLHVHYAQGVSLAEAVYLSVSGPYQLLVVGDPLCRLWGDGPGVPGSVGAVGSAVLIPAGTMPAAVSVQRGLRLLGEGGARVVSGVGKAPPWWESAGVQPGAAVTLEFLVEARRDDHYQFQVRSAGGATVHVGDTPLPPTGRGPWQTFPASLAAGWHPVRMVLSAGGGGDEPWTGAPLEVRFGAVGVLPLSEVAHVVPRDDDAVHYLGARAVVRVDDSSDGPLDVGMHFGIAGLEGAPEGRLLLDWDSGADGGWSVTPAQAEAVVAGGESTPIALRVRYAGAAFVDPGFFRLPNCTFRFERGGQWHTVAPQVLPLDTIMRKRPRPVLAVPRAVHAPVIDGVPDEAAWAGAVGVPGFVRPQLDRPTGQPTAAWLMWDDEALYLAARCTEPEVDALRLRARYRDDEAFNDDSLEIFVAAAGDGEPYVQIVVNAAGVVYDERGRDRAWDGDFEHATGREADAWTLELALPWTVLGVDPPASGSSIHVLMARNRVGGGPCELSMWPCSPGGNHQPDRFAAAVLMAEPAAPEAGGVQR